MTTSSNQIYIALQHAAQREVLYPKIRISSFVFSPSKYPETVYVKHSKTKDYLGKIIGDTFYPVSKFAVTQEEIAAIQQIVKTPLPDLIQVQGTQSGQCCFCGRKLLAGLSVAASIGPVCAEKYGISQEARAADITSSNLGF